jgi:hypothetical protein
MADTKISALTAVTSLDGTELVPVVQGGASKSAKVSDIRTIDIVKTVAVTQSTTSTTPAAITDLSSSLTPGTYLVKVWMVLQSTATGTGVGIHLNCSGGTVTTCAATWYSLTTATSTATGVMDQASASTVFQHMEGRAQRANNTSGAPFGGVDTANADQFAVLEGVVIVTATTTLQVMIASETAGTGVSARVGTSLTVSKVA